MSNPTISISYLPIPIKDSQSQKVIGERFFPFIDIRISHKNIISESFRALVDSGSDRNLFPAKVGELIGINFEKSIARTIKGIGGIRIKAYTRQVKLYLYDHAFDTEIDFSYQQDLLLLGREGFFNLFKGIRFREKDRFLDLEF